MKSKDLQKLVLSKYENGDGPTKIFRDLNGAISLQTIERWCKSIRDTGCINLSRSPGRPKTIRTKAAIRKIKSRVERRKSVSSRKIARELGISRTSVRRILKNDLELQAYKIQKEPLLTDEHKEKRMKFANWIRTNFRKEGTMNILFSDEKMFDIDGVYNSQNDRIWAANRSEADIKGGIRQKRKFPQKVMVWLGVCSKGVSPLVIFENGTVNHERYIKEVLPVALKFGNDMFGNDWTFQQDGARPHTHKKSQEWCAKHFPSFIGEKDWPPNSPDLNPLDYCIWNEFAQLINWDAVTSKTTLISAVKRAVHKISQDVVFESCSSWTNRLYRLSQNKGNYLR
jgi:inhibitor of nuclear factor kappa-B kinase subunit alpha